MTEALRRCLALEDAEVVGCVAQLATVQDADLARLLSASYRSIMELLVVKTEATRKRVAQHLVKHKVRARAEMPGSSEDQQTLTNPSL